MKISTKEVGEYTYLNQLQISLQIGLPKEFVIRVKFFSDSRTATRYEIYDHCGDCMGGRQIIYATMGVAFASALVEDLNVLLEEFQIQLKLEDCSEAIVLAVSKCESRYGNGTEDGDALMEIY